MSVLQIITLVVEIVAVALVGIVLDRYLGDRAAVVGLAVCLLLVGWLHREQIKPLFHKSPPPFATAPQPKEEPPATTTAQPKSLEPPPKAKAKRPTEVKSVTPLDKITDTQRNLLKEDLAAMNDVRVHGIRIVCIGSKPRTTAACDELVKIFSSAGWTVEHDQIGGVSVVGISFPDGPYLTDTGVVSEYSDSTKVFNLFSGFGIDLPFVPGAYAGPSALGQTSTMVIVIH